jgi:hypothetical protein
MHVTPGLDALHALVPRRSGQARGIALVGKRVRPKAGDVLEVGLRDGRLAYLQMVAESPMGDVARVLAGRHRPRPSDVASLVAAPHEYLIFAMLGQLVRDGHAVRIGGWLVPDGTWSGLRLSPRYDRSMRVEAWLVTDGRTARQRLESLPDSVRKEFPIWQIGDSQHVADMLLASSTGGLEASELQAWRAEHGLTAAPGAEGADEAGDEPGVEHYALFGTGARLDQVIAGLDERGFSCRVVTDADVAGQVLVIRAGARAPGFIDDQWDQVEEVVTAAGGEYDGWEASMGKHRP